MRCCCIVLFYVLLLQPSLHAEDSFVRNGSSSSQPKENVSIEVSDKEKVEPETLVKGKKLEANQKIPKPKSWKRGMNSAQSPEASNFMPSTAKIITIIGLITFLAGLAIYLKFKKNPRFGRKDQGDCQLKLLSNLSLASGTLSLVALGEKIYLIGSNDHAMTCLDQIVDPIEKDKIIYNTEQEAAPSGFRSEYNDMLHQMNQGVSTEVEPEVLSEELDNLKERLKELA